MNIWELFYNVNGCHLRKNKQQNVLLNNQYSKERIIYVYANSMFDKDI